jgi:HPt (histidine-containing phosphotransfer) domain-containing protein
MEMSDSSEIGHNSDITENIPIISNHFNRETLLDRVSGDVEFARQMVDMGIQEIDSQLPTLKTLLKNRNWADLRNLSHKLKGLTRSISFVLLGDFFEELENITKSDNPDYTLSQELIQSIEFEFSFMIEIDFFDD